MPEAKQPFCVSQSQVFLIIQHRLEATAIVKKNVECYKEAARDYERINEWAERIGWHCFFKVTGLPYTKYHIDN